MLHTSGVMLQGGTGYGVMYHLSQEQKKLLDSPLLTLFVVCGLSAAAHNHLPLLPGLQHKGQWPDGASNNCVS